MIGPQKPLPVAVPDDTAAPNPEAWTGAPNYDSILTDANRYIAKGAPQGMVDQFVREETNGRFGSHAELRSASSRGPLNLLRSAMNSATVGLWPRIAGRLSPIAHALAPDVTPNDYEAVKNDETRRAQQFGAVNPGTNFGTGLLGAAATGGIGGEALGIREGSSLLGAGLKGAGVGAGAGAVGAAADQPDLTAPDWSDIARKTLTGAGVGAGLAAAAFEGMRFFAPWLARSRARHALSPSESPGLADMDALYSRTGRGDIRTLADLSPALESEGDFAATANPDVKAKYRGQYAERANGQSERLQNDLTAGYGREPNATSYAADLRNKIRTISNDPQTGYAAVAQQAGGPIKDDALTALLQRPGVDDAVARARKSLATGGKQLAPNDPRVLFRVYRTLRDDAGRAFTSGASGLGSDLRQAHSDLSDLLQQHVPAFKQLNAQLSPLLASEDALQDAPNFFTNVDRQTLAAKLAKMPPEAVDAYREGTANALRTSLDAARTNQNIAGQIERLGPSFQSKLQLIFGTQDKMGAFMDAARAESELRQRGSMFAGSQTAGREQEIQTAPKMRISTDPGGIYEGLKARLFENVPLFNTRNMARKAGQLEAPWLFTPGQNVDAARAELMRRRWPDRLQTAAPAAAVGAQRGLLADSLDTER